MSRIKRGKFITILGINNIGKSTQAEFLKNRIWKGGDRRLPLSVKYPFYELEPIGPMLNDYLRHENPLNLTPREFQTLQAFHRLQVEPQILKTLERGVHVIAEDYMGTGIAWGLGSGVDEEYLFKINSKLLVDDLTILLNGNRFLEAKESDHTHESNNALVEKVRRIHLEIALDCGWSVVNANVSKEIVHENIWKIVQPILNS